MPPGPELLPLYASFSFLNLSGIDKKELRKIIDHAKFNKNKSNLKNKNSLKNKT